MLRNKIHRRTRSRNPIVELPRCVQSEVACFPDRTSRLSVSEGTCDSRTEEAEAMGKDLPHSHRNPIGSELLPCHPSSHEQESPPDHSPPRIRAPCTGVLLDVLLVSGIHRVLATLCLCLRQARRMAVRRVCPGGILRQRTRKAQDPTVLPLSTIPPRTVRQPSHLNPRLLHPSH